MTNSASEKRWKPGSLAGVPFNRRLSSLNLFHDGPDDLLFGEHPATAKFLELSCRDTIANASDEKICQFSFSFSSLTFHSLTKIGLLNVDVLMSHCWFSSHYTTRQPSAFLIKPGLWETNATQPWRDLLGQPMTALRQLHDLRDPLTPT